MQTALLTVTASRVVQNKIRLAAIIRLIVKEMLIIRSFSKFENVVLKSLGTGIDLTAIKISNFSVAIFYFEPPCTVNSQFS